MVKQLTILFLLLNVNYLSVAQTSLFGNVADAETGKELIGANVVLEKNGVFIVGNSTDFKGNFKLDLDPGTYDVFVSYLNYPNQLILEVLVKADHTNKLDIKMIGSHGCLITSFSYSPLIEIDNATSGLIQTSDNIQRSPYRETYDLILNVTGVSAADY